MTKPTTAQLIRAAEMFDASGRNYGYVERVNAIHFIADGLAANRLTPEQGRDLRAMATLRSSRFGPGHRICFARADAGWIVFGDNGVHEVLNPSNVPFFPDPADAIEWAESVLPVPPESEPSITDSSQSATDHE